MTAEIGNSTCSIGGLSRVNNLLDSGAQNLLHITITVSCLLVTFNILIWVISIVRRSV